MKRMLAVAAIALAACAAPLPQTPPPGQAAEVGPPSIRTGASWSYVAHDGYTGLPRGSYEERVTGVQGNTVTVEVRHGNRAWTERYTREWNWLERPMRNLQDFRYDPPYAALPFPLAAGKSWQAFVHATDPATGRVNRVRIDGYVLGWEHVKVPAGEFVALKVRRYVYAGNFGSFRTEERIEEYDWYAPQPGLVVKSEGWSEHLDTSMSCKSQCNVVRGDWIVKELSRLGG